MTHPRNAWAEPGPDEVSPGVYRLPLPLLLDSLHAVNVYVVEDESGLTVIDSGWANPGTRAALTTGLHRLGHDIGDVSQFLVTHAHWDHYTQAIALRREFGTAVRIGIGERPSIDAFAVGDTAAYPEQGRLLRKAGALDLARDIAAWQMTDDELAMPFGEPDTWLADGEKVALPNRTLEVIATPGHTRGHIVLRDADAALLFAGDHVLPHITPSIGLERAPEPAPLRSYLASLELLRDQPDVVLLPAHGPVATSVHTRVAELLQHHEQRLAEVVALLRDGRSCAYDIAQAMRWTRHERALDDLDLSNRMMAVLEIQAHLDVLEMSGVVVAVETEPVARFIAR